MPGIAGVISRDHRPENMERLRSMVACMQHESFYESGTYRMEHLGLWVGWTCLSGSFSDCMPIFNEKRDIVLFWAGEDYVDPNTVEELKRRGHLFNGQNASYLIHMYEEDEERFFLELNGFFSGLVLDMRQGKILLLNDRIGMGRVYYHEDADEFIFSSEAKSLLKVKPELREVDEAGLGEYFLLGSVLEDRTLFAGIRRMPGGSVWVFDGGGLRRRAQYFSPAHWEEQVPMDEARFMSEFQQTFRAVLPRCFRSGGTVALSLTGGWDTRAILACLDLEPGELPCYTFGGMLRDSYDVRISREIAQACSQPHTVLGLDSGFLDGFAALAEKTVYVTDGCCDVCGAHEVYFNQLARTIAPVRMTGNYGSEVLRGFSTFKKRQPLAGLFSGGFLPHLERAERMFEAQRKGKRLSFTVFKEIPGHLHRTVSAAWSQLSVRTPYLDNRLVGLLYRAPEAALASVGILDDNEIQKRIIAANRPELLNIFTDRGEAGRGHPLLRKLTRVFCMGTFKAEYYYNTGMPDWVAGVDRHLKTLNPGRLILGRHKFDMYRLWFRSELGEYIGDILLDDKTASRPYLNKGIVRRIVDEHLAGRKNHLHEINRLLTSELIHRLLIEDA